MMGFQQKKGDGYIIVFVYIKIYLNSILKKWYDCNYNVKNIGKNIYVVKKILVKVFYIIYIIVF